MRQLDAGTIFSATALLDRPEAGEPEELTDEVIEELTGGITDERAITRILDATGSKGLNYGRAISREVRQTIETNQALSQQGLSGAGAMLLSDVLDPADAVIMAATASGVAAVAPPLAPVTAPVAAAGGDAGSAAAEKEPDTVMLKKVDNKIAAIKVVRAITGLGLKEAKELVEKAPVVVKDGLTKDDVESFKAQLEEAGCEVEVK